MKKIGTIYALAAMAVAGIHFEAGDVIRGEGIDEETRRKLVQHGKATTEKPEKLIEERRIREKAAAEAEAEDEAARQAEIEETIRPAVEKIVGEMLAKQAKAKA